LKADFKSAAQASDSDEGGFVVKGKRKDLSDSEPDEKEADEGTTGRLVTDKELLARFYGEEKSLDKSDRFLRNYILQEGWKGTMRETDPKLIERADEEDENREDEFDKFEYAMNFRYEDPNAATITSHARNALKEETLRR
jgi:protein KRI1